MLCAGLYNGDILFSYDFNYVKKDSVIGRKQFSLSGCPYHKSYGCNHICDTEYSFLNQVELEEKSFFYIHYLSQNQFLLKLGESIYSLPSSDEEVVYFISLSGGSKLDSFSIHTPGDISYADLIYDIGIVDSIDNYASSQNYPLLIENNKEIQLYLPEGLDYQSLSVSLSSQVVGAGYIFSIKIGKKEKDYKWTEYRITMREGDNTIWFHNNNYKEKPNSIIIGDQNILLNKITFYSEFSDNEAITADIETLINWEVDDWRNEMYELFRWDLYPEILIFDYYSFRIQSLFLKRLAFFIEKKGYSGVILSDSELRDKYGWSAHNYKPDDLVRFYNEVDRIGFQLNEYELLLKEILIRNGVVKNDNGLLIPVKGGLLSFSRNSSDRLRWKLLTHECFHGLFYLSKEYYEKVYDLWNSLSIKEKDFWMIFFDNYRNGYDVKNNEYLLINEFQAYLMQQGISETGSYFKKGISQLLNNHPYLESKVDFTTDEYDLFFTQKARYLEETVYSISSIRAGDLVLKRKK